MVSDLLGDPVVSIISPEVSKSLKNTGHFGNIDDPAIYLSQPDG